MIVRSVRAAALGLLLPPAPTYETLLAVRALRGFAVAHRQDHPIEETS